MLMAATTPATSVSLPGVTSVPILALSPVNVTSGTMAKGNGKVSTTRLSAQETQTASGGLPTIG